MEFPKKDALFYVFGAYFFSLGVLAIFNSLLIKNPTQVFWMCYLSLIILGIGIFRKNSFLILSQIYILLIPFLVWDLDFFYWLILHKPLFGITDYFFLENVFTLSKFISLQHLYTIPLSLFFAFKIKFPKKNFAWVLSLVQIFVVYVLVSLLTLPESNINCVFSSCINVHFGLPYRLTWFLIFFAMVFVNYLVVEGFRFLRRKN